MLLLAIGDWAKNSEFFHPGISYVNLEAVLIQNYTVSYVKLMVGGYHDPIQLPWINPCLHN